MKLMKKSMAAILALAMCLSLLPVNVFAAVISDGHEHNTDGYVCTPCEVPADELVCGEVVHTHGDECYMIPEGMWDCIFAEHEHSTDYDELTGESFCPADSHVCGGECTVYCGETAHSHSEFCGYDDVTGAWFCGKEAHSHSFACYQAQRQLMCTQAEHEHSAACYATETVWDCQAPEEPTVADMGDEEDEYDTPDADPADPADIEDGEDTQKVYYENGGTYPVSSAEELYDALYADGNFTITLTANIEINGFDFPLERDGRGDIDGLPVYDGKTAAADSQPVYGGEFWVNGSKTLKQFMEIANSKSNDGAYLLQGDGSITVYAAWKQKTETKSYTVEYYLDGNLDEGKSHTVTVENIPITDTVLTVDSKEVNTSNAFGADAEFSHIGDDRR